MNIDKITSKKGKFLIFKTSKTCGMCHAAQAELEKYKESPEALEIIKIDVNDQKKLKIEIADHYNERHESPQILLIEDQKLKRTINHWNIKLKELKKL
jgi:bacillithiol system protein YtxJ